MPKRRRKVVLFGALMFLTAAFALPAATSANAAVSIAGTGSAHSVVRSDISVSLSMTAKAVTPATVVTCTVVTGLSHPGNTLYSYGYFTACTGGGVECAATADMQEESVGSGSWSTVGNGPTEYGCPPDMGISTVTATCHSTPHAFNYRTRGIYVLSGETSSTKVSYSPVTTLYDACTT